MNPTLTARLRNVRRGLCRAGATAMLLVDPVSVRYVSGFTGGDSWLLVTSGKVTLITDGRYEEQAERECPDVERVIRHGPIVDAAGGLVGRRGLKRVGFDPERVSVALRRRLERALRPATLTPVEDLVGHLRRRKDPSEVRAIRQAVRVAQEAWAAFRERIEVGMTEQRLAAELDGQMRLVGAEAPAFPTICAVDASASMPHARPGRRMLGKRSVLLVDFGARVGGYVCDLTRCLVTGRIPPRVREVYETVREAQEAAIRRAGPGVALAVVDAAAREVIEAAGLGERFQHGTGHGIGMEIHEPPALSPQSRGGCLDAGMVVTVEPGVYLKGRFGIRIEDDVLVTKSGRRVLTSLEKDLEAMVL